MNDCIEVLGWWVSNHFLELMSEFCFLNLKLAESFLGLSHGVDEAELMLTSIVIVESITMHLEMDTSTMRLAHKECIAAIGVKSDAEFFAEIFKR